MIHPDPLAPITEPGLYDLPADTYHGDPVPGGSLSQSRAKVLLDEGGPALFKHREAVREDKKTFDEGTVAHVLALGSGAERLVHVDADSYRTKDAQEQRDAAYADGKTPVLPRQLDVAEAMAEKLTASRAAMDALQGHSEVAAFAIHGSGLWLRGQLDKFAPGSHIGDYKTCVDASSWGFPRAVYRYRYYLQAFWYRALVHWLTGELLPYLLVAQEKTAPYRVSVWEPDVTYMRMGAEDMEAAIRTYLECTESGEWPGYPDEVQALSPPAWAFDDELELSL